jgi:hypothetical protein
MGVGWQNYVMAVVSVACEHGKEQGILKDNPVRGVKRLKRPQAQGRRPVLHRCGCSFPHSDKSRFLLPSNAGTNEEFVGMGLEFIGSAKDS